MAPARLRLQEGCAGWGRGIFDMASLLGSKRAGSWIEQSASHEMNVQRIDLGDEVRQGVQLRFDLRQS